MVERKKKNPKTTKNVKVVRRLTFGNFSYLIYGENQTTNLPRERWEDEKVGFRRGARRKWEQMIKKTERGSRNEDAADWECQGKGQLPLQHFALINYGREWPG